VPRACGQAAGLGAFYGVEAVIAAATAGDRTVYAGSIKPFEKPNAGLRYGGAALAVTGAAVAATVVQRAGHAGGDA